MYKFDQRVAEVIGNYVDDPSWSAYRWYEEEINDLALKFAVLDYLPKKALVTLARLSAQGPLDTKALARETEFDTAELEDHLDALLENNLVATCANGFETTDSGKEVFRALGTKLVNRKLFEMKGRIDHLESIRKAIGPMWHKPSASPASEA